MNTQIQPQPDVWSRLAGAIGHLFGFLLRLIFIVLLAIALGAGIYFGIPWAYGTFVQPVQTNTAQLAVLSQRLDGFRSTVESQQGAQDERLTALEVSDDSRRERLSASEAALTDLQKALGAEAAARQALEMELSALRAEQTARATDIANLREALAGVQAASAKAAAEDVVLRRTLALQRVRNSLLQARLQLAAENLGEARQVLELSRTQLSAYVGGLDGVAAETHAALVNRLLAAQTMIATQPAAALAELESIWAQLDGMLSGPPPSSGSTP